MISFAHDNRRDDGAFAFDGLYVIVPVITC